MGSAPCLSKHKYTFILVSADKPSSKRMSHSLLDFSFFTFLKIPSLIACRLLRICKTGSWGKL